MSGLSLHSFARQLFSLGGDGDHAVAALLFGGIKHVVRPFDQIGDGFVGCR
jgi:hypothetical protein